jgi:hypothetical protein
LLLLRFLSSWGPQLIPSPSPSPRGTTLKTASKPNFFLLFRLSYFLRSVCPGPASLCLDSCFREIWDSDSDSIDRPRGPPFPFIYLAIVCPSVRLPSNRLTKAISRYYLPAAPSGPEYPPPSPIYLFLRRAAGMILCPCDFRHRSTMVMAVGRLKGEEDREHDVLYVCIFLLRLLFSISFAWMLVTEQALSTDIILW